jgi:hypothetical protein
VSRNTLDKSPLSCALSAALRLPAGHKMLVAAVATIEALLADYGTEIHTALGVSARQARRIVDLYRRVRSDIGAHRRGPYRRVVRMASDHDVLECGHTYYWTSRHKKDRRCCGQCRSHTNTDYSRQRRERLRAAA